MSEKTDSWVLGAQIETRDIKFSNLKKDQHVFRRHVITCLIFKRHVNHALFKNHIQMPQRPITQYSRRVLQATISNFAFKKHVLRYLLSQVRNSSKNSFYFTILMNLCHHCFPLPVVTNFSLNNVTRKFDIQMVI